MAMRRLKPAGGAQVLADMVADYTPMEARPITDIPLTAMAPAPGAAQTIEQSIEAVPQVRPTPRRARSKYYTGELHVESLTPEMVQAMLYPEPKPLTAKEQKLQALVKTIPVKRDPKWDR